MGDKLNPRSTPQQQTEVEALDVKLLTICMIRDGDKVLLLNKLNHPDPHSRGFIPPGGKVERGESPVEAAMREVMEETGLVVSELVYKGLYEYENSSTGARYMIFNYMTTHFEGDLRSDSPEGTVEWVPIEVARTLPMEAFLDESVRSLL